MKGGAGGEARCIVMQTPLREGFTTGTAAAAAAFAAVGLLLGGPLPATVEVVLPPFAEDGTPLAGGKASGNGAPSAPPTLVIPVEQGGAEGDAAFAAVIKDGGDDPDATHGARIIVHAAFRPFAPRADEGGEPFALGLPRPPGLPTGQAAASMELNLFSRRIVLYGGEGVGTATLPGLPVAVGEPAINPEPRKQIAVAAHAAARAAGYDGPLHLLVSAPDGRERARHTLNARLGIVGGISILGTRGTVRPYSHDAWKAAIVQGLDVAEALGLRAVLLSTGRRSERLGFALYPDLPVQAGIQAADYAAFSLREAAGRPFASIMWVCFPGKLLKLAQGLEWTHAKTAPADIPLLARYCREAGGPEEVIAALESMPTAAGALALMERSAPALRDAVLRRLAGAAMDVMRGWVEAAVPAGSCPELVLHVFSLEERLLLNLRTE